MFFSLRWALSQGGQYLYMMSMYFWCIRWMFYKKYILFTDTKNIKLQRYLHLPHTVEIMPYVSIFVNYIAYQTNAYAYLSLAL